MNSAAGTGGSAENDGFGRARSEGREIADGPGCAEETALTGVHIGHADAPIVRIGRRSSAIGIVATADAGGADAPGLACGYCRRRIDNEWQGLKRLHDRPVIGSMDDRRGGVADVIEEVHEWPTPVELGEKAMRPTADPRLWESHERRPADCLQR